MSFAAVASSLSLEVTYPFLGCRVARQHWRSVCVGGRGGGGYLPCGLVAAVRFVVCLASNEGHKLPALSAAAAAAAADLILLLISSSNCLCVCRCVYSASLCVGTHCLLPPLPLCLLSNCWQCFLFHIVRQHSRKRDQQQAQQQQHPVQQQLQAEEPQQHVAAQQQQQHLLC